MIQIQPVIFPLNLGEANKIDINISANTGIDGARIIFNLFDDSVNPIKRLSNGFFDLSQEDFATRGNDKEWITNYVASQLGITLV